MKISASSLNASTWTKVLETFCLKEKHWWCQNLNQTLTVIRSAKMRENEVRHLTHLLLFTSLCFQGKDWSHCRSVWSPPAELLPRL
uniref:Uncharacterized protein n=1 Tax=Cyanistes caeruleus TaxID=156563 RepID=A0A8C0UFB5_CYACU